MPLVAKILLPLPFEEFDYLIPPQKDFSVGDLVEAPFRNKRLIGLITSFEDIDEPKFKLKYVIATMREKGFETPTLSMQFLEFIKKQSEYYLQEKGNIFSLCFSQKFFKEKKRKPKEKVVFKRSSVQKTELNSEQQTAYENITRRISLPSLRTGAKQSILTSDTQSPMDCFVADTSGNDKNIKKFSVTLLDGVTGSGKTEVFFQLAEDVINQDRQALIMLPEILLTSQIVSRFENRFADDVIIWHSGISDGKKKKHFFDIINGRAKIIIGARSALELPYKNLGIIICDEEHDSSYKQDEGVVYNARDMAVLRGKIENIPVILSSATPSIETINNVNEGKYFEEKLTKRYSQIDLPKIELIDMRTQKLKANEFISEALKNEIQKTLDEKKQVMLFLNRRGYAPLVICGTCGHRIKSPDTSAWMVLHYDRQKNPYLQCHHSGYRTKLPEACPECKAAGSFRPCGPGVQRIAEEIKLLFPQYKTLEMASDSMTSKKKADEFLEQILSGSADIIIGTQIIAKGHHFPNLKMVGVIDADLGLDFSDLRAGEKTFQLLQQVSGRAGRENEQGEVFLQTYNPSHQVLLAIKNYDKEGFTKYEIDQRKLGNLPPFSKFTSLIISGKEETETNKFSKLVASKLIQTKDVKILGPAEAMFHELRGWFRYRLLLVCAKNYNIQNYIKKSFADIKIPVDTKLKIDIDPYNFS